MEINYLETTFKVMNEDRSLKSIQISERTELIPAQGMALLNKNTGKIYNTGHVISENESAEDYVEVEDR